MAARQKHPRKELNGVLIDAYEQGWRVTRGTYFKLFCPCEGKHKKTLHLTPSDPNYEKNWRKHAARTTCWTEAGS